MHLNKGQNGGIYHPRAWLLAGCCLFLSVPAVAQVLPGPADVGRIKPEEKFQPPISHQDQNTVVPESAPTVPIPPEAKHIRFVLKTVTIEGATIFSKNELADIYQADLGHEITLDRAYVMAEAITKRYRDAGYFLSLAYVPPQSIKEGTVTIKVIEGYIAEVNLADDAGHYSVVQGYIDKLLAERPVKSASVESFLLRMNDLPGLSFRAVLSNQEGSAPGSTKLTLVPASKKSVGSISYDNFSSRYLGPNEISASYSTSLLPLQQTTVSGLASLPLDKLRFGTLSHSIVVAPNTTVDLEGGVTKARPGYKLEDFDIDSKATFISVDIAYQWWRQRDENLGFKLMFDGRNVDSELLDTPLSRDHIRAVRASANYDLTDHWNGYNIANLTISQGIAGLGASNAGDLNLSRSDARPDFTKAELSLSRLQSISPDWSVLASANGQLASGTLYSSEEFGYGGQSFGRAFDTSEITGDQGIAAALELRYGGWSNLSPLSIQPYAFYDFGAVWNHTVDQPARDSGASIGFGMRFATDWEQTGMIGVAWPLTRDISAPIYGMDASGPRISLQISQGF